MVGRLKPRRGHLAFLQGLSEFKRNLQMLGK